MLNQMLGYSLLASGVAGLIFQMLVLLRSASVRRANRRGERSTLWQFASESASVAALGALHLYAAPLRTNDDDTEDSYRDYHHQGGAWSCERSLYTKYLIFAMSLAQCSFALMLYVWDCFRIASSAQQNCTVDDGSKIEQEASKKCEPLMYRAILLPIVVHCLLVLPIIVTERQVVTVSLQDLRSTACPELMNTRQCDSSTPTSTADSVNVYKDVINIAMNATKTHQNGENTNATEQVDDIIAKIRKAVYGFNETHRVLSSKRTEDKNDSSSSAVDDDVEEGDEMVYFYVRPHDFNLNTTLMARRPKAPLECVPLCTPPRALVKIHLFMIILFGFVTPLFVSVVFYMKLIHVAGDKARVVVADDALNKQTASEANQSCCSRRKIRNAKSSIIVSVLLWSPAIIDTALKDLLCVTKTNIEIDNLFYLVANAYFIIREALNLYVARSHQIIGSTITPN